MADYVIMPGADYQDACDAVREKTGGTSLIKSGEMGGLIRGISGGGGDTPSEEWIGDGNTHIWISLPEGRTSPRLGCCPQGTVTVDWGDGTEPDVLTGRSTSSTQHTPVHNYASAGDYVITLTVDGKVGFYSTTYTSILKAGITGSGNSVYYNAVKKIELGNGVTSIDQSAFASCNTITSINIPDGVTSIGNYAFSNCYGFKSINIPDGVTSIGNSAFQNCYCLASITIPNGVTSIGSSAFASCNTITSINIPDGVTSIKSSAFQNCYCLTSITIPNGVTSIETSLFYNCSGMAFVDFTNHTAVPTLVNYNAFANVPSDCEIRVPAALAEEWKAATNWSTYASKIVGV